MTNVQDAALIRVYPHITNKLDVLYDLGQHLITKLDLCPNCVARLLLIIWNYEHLSSYLAPLAPGQVQNWI